MDTATRLEGTKSLLDQIRQTCDEGRVLDTLPWLDDLEQADDLASLTWRSRLLNHLGDGRASDALALRLGRRHPDSLQARTLALRAAGRTRGPHAAWRELQKGPIGDGDDEDRAEWLSLRAYTWALLRDFDRAWADHAEAQRLAPQQVWLKVEQAYSLMQADRHDDALACALDAHSMSPAYPPAIQVLAQCRLNRADADEAMRLLSEAVAQGQYGHLALALCDIQLDQRLLEPAALSLQRAETCLPLADRVMRRCLAGRQADLKFFQGDLAGAVERARAAGPGFFHQLAERLERIEGPQRSVLLPVGFVRQHHKTCGPATLTALARYWGCQAEHLDVAEAICYDGTPHHSERRWVEDAGLLAQEFTVDWVSACALLDEGVPFTLTTVATTSAHLQAVIGYDRWRRTLWIRDPSQQTHTEADADALFASHRSAGPRGMVVCPLDRADRVKALALPDAPLWDGYHRLMLALTQHRRDDAVAEAKALEACSPGHRLAEQARRAIAQYDGQDEQVLASVERSLTQFPWDPNLCLHKAALLRANRSREQQQAWWDDLLSSAPFDAQMALRHVQFLQEDTRQNDAVQRGLRRILRAMPQDAAAWHACAQMAWADGRRDEALDAFRIACCLGDSNEALADTYARAAAAQGRPAEAVDFLRQRMLRALPLSCEPVFTLFLRLEAMDQAAQAHEVLADAVRARPQDGALRLFAAEICLRYNRVGDGLDHLAAAASSTKRASWLRVRAQYHKDADEWSQAIELLREACELEPISPQGQRLMAEALQRVQGVEAALQHVRAIAGQFPHQFELQRLLLSYLPGDAHDEIDQVLGRMKAQSPFDTWVLRERVLRLTQAGRTDEAQGEAAFALEQDPADARNHAVRGFVLRRLGRVAEAVDSMRRALVCSVDNEFAFHSLLELARSHEERVAFLGFVRGEMVRQVTTGDALLSYQEWARGTLPEAEVLVTLQEARVQRPDLWQAGLTVARQCVRMGRTDEGIATLKSTIDRFPLLPRLHLEMSAIAMLQHRWAEAHAACDQALALSPAWPEAVRRKVDVIAEEGGDMQAALAILDAALRRHPSHADLLGLRGWVRWQLKQREPSVTDLSAAVRSDPSLAWLWDALQQIAGAPAVRQLVDELTRAQPHSTAVWQRAVVHAETIEQMEAAATQGLAIEPAHAGIHEARLQRWLQAGCINDIRRVLASKLWPEGGMPLSIEVYGPRVERAMHQLEKAVQGLKALTDRHPDVYGLWRELAEWTEPVPDLQAEHLSAARQMVRLAPHTALGYAHLGLALRRAREFADAIKAYQQALDIDPGYTFVSRELADVYLENRIHDQVASVLDRAESRNPSSAELHLRRVRLAVANGDQNQAVRKAIETFVLPEATAQVSEQVIQSVVKAGWAKSLTTALADAVLRPGCEATAVRYWLEQELGRTSDRKFLKMLGTRLASDAHGSLARGVAVWLAEQPDGTMVTRVIKNHGPMLSRDPDVRQALVFALVQHALFDEAVAWFDGWRNDPALDVPTLLNCVMSLRQVGRIADAQALGRRVLELDPGQPVALLWAAADAAHGRDGDALARLLARVQVAELRPYYERLRGVLQAYAQALAGRDSRKAVDAFRGARMAARRDPVLQRLLDACRAHLVWRLTPAWLVPWRWLQFHVG